MFIPVFESMGKISAATGEMQHEFFKKWFSLWPAFQSGPIVPPASREQFQTFQKQWAEVSGDLIRRHREVIEAQFKASQQQIESAFRIGEAKTPEELRNKTFEFWNKCIEAVRQNADLQLGEFQQAVGKWTDLMKPPVPPS